MPTLLSTGVARLIVTILIGFSFASRASACGTCPACRLAQSCDGQAPVEGWEVAQIMSDVGGGGSAADPIQPGSWTLAITPDTQHYSANSSNLYHFFNQTQWLADNRDSHNIKMVLHEGDITNNNNVTQWDRAKSALSILDTGNVPYALAPGNHDYGPNGNSSNRDTLFHNNEYFGPTSPYANQSTVGGFFENGKTDNSWHTFNAGGNDWIVFTMEFGPRDEVIAWANDVLEDHSDKLAMLVTHAYMYYDETIYDWATKGSSQSWNPHSYGVANQPGQTVNDGQELWDNFVKLHENFRFVFNGHVLGDGTGYRATLGDNGNVVHQMLANFQMNAEGGQGDMRLLEFLADGETVNVRTYSPSLDRYDTDSDQQFTLNLNSLPPPPPPLFQAVSANFVVGGPTTNGDNTVGSVVVAESGSPGVGTGQLNRGDYQPTIDGRQVRYQQGIMLASITQHDRPDFVNRRATVEVGRNPFGDGNMSLALTEAGSGGGGEVNFNTSIAWFDFSGGWTGAHVNGDGTIPAEAFNNVTQAQVTRTNTGRYTVNMGANAQSEGLLFTIGNNNSNIVVQTGLLAGGTSWDVRVQQNTADFSATGVDQDWSFLYLPYTTENLVGGLYNGNTNSHVSSVGDFTMTRLSTGQYQLAIDGQSPETGMLITTVTNQTSFSGTTAPDDNILSYQPGPNGTFLINSYDLGALNFQNTAFSWAFVGFDDQLSLEPIAPTPTLGFTLDRTTGQVLLTNVGEVEAEIVSVAILSGGGALQSENWKSITNFYDALPQDGSVDPDHAWSIITETKFSLSEHEPTEIGATLATDQEIDFGEDVWKKSRIEDVVMRVELADGTVLFETVNFIGGPGGSSYHRSDLNTDGVITEADWSFFYPNMLADLSLMTTVERALAGDLNGDGKNDVKDFVLFKADYEFFHGSGSFDQMLASVPEPSTWGFLIVAGIASILVRRRWS